MSLRDDCPTIYGPVKSRRHGLSLGINLGDPLEKACTWSCIYCQCGFGHRIEAGESRRIPSRQKVLSELKVALGHPSNLARLDSVTLAGNSEPTSHPEFSAIVSDVLLLREELGAKWIFNALSNGSELGDPQIRSACDRLDEIWVKLDCATDELFKRVNRPVATVGSVTDHIQRISLLKKPRLQILFWQSPPQGKALGNWTEVNREALKLAFQTIQPQQIFMTTLQREPATPELIPVPATEIENFANQVQSMGFDVKVFV